jgi:hypothetical protein
MSPQETEIAPAFKRALPVYTSRNEEANIKLVELDRKRDFS